MSLVYSGKLLSGCCHRIQALFNIMESFGSPSPDLAPPLENISLEASISKASKFLPRADILLSPVVSRLANPEPAVPGAAPAKVHYVLINIETYSTQLDNCLGNRRPENKGLPAACDRLFRILVLTAGSACVPQTSPSTAWPPVSSPPWGLVQQAGRDLQALA